MVNYKIEHDLPGCIGCSACAAISDNWEMKDIDGEEKADFIKGNIETEDELNENKEAAECCPVEVIHIVNNDTGEKII